MNRFIIPLVLLLLLGGGLAYFMYNKPHRDIAKEKAAFVTTADDLFAAFENDENAANAKYLDKVLEITGKVVETGKNKEGLANAVLEAKDAMMGGVSVTLSKDATGSFEKGQTVKLKCNCTGKLMDVVLVNCFKQ